MVYQPVGAPGRCWWSLLVSLLVVFWLKIIQNNEDAFHRLLAKINNFWSNIRVIGNHCQGIDIGDLGASQSTLRLRQYHYRCPQIFMNIALRFKDHYDVQRKQSKTVSKTDVQENIADDTDEAKLTRREKHNYYVVKSRFKAEKLNIL